MPLFLLNLIAQAIYDKKGSNILALDLRSFSTLSEFAIIAEGNVDRHVIAIAHAIEKATEEKGIRPLRAEGMKEGDWVVLDYPNIMVHLFMPGMRERYQLEQLWKEAEIVDLHIDVSNKVSDSYKNFSQFK